MQLMYFSNYCLFISFSFCMSMSTKDTGQFVSSMFNLVNISQGDCSGTCRYDLHFRSKTCDWSAASMLHSHWLRLIEDEPTSLV